MMHRHFFKIASKNPEYVENFCNEPGNRLHFRIRKWIEENGFC